MHVVLAKKSLQNSEFEWGAQLSLLWLELNTVSSSRTCTIQVTNHNCVLILFSCYRAEVHCFSKPVWWLSTLNREDRWVETAIHSFHLHSTLLLSLYSHRWWTTPVSVLTRWRVWALIMIHEKVTYISVGELLSKWRRRWLPFLSIIIKQNT